VFGCFHSHLRAWLWRGFIPQSS